VSPDSRRPGTFRTPTPVPRHRVRLAVLTLGTAGSLVAMFHYDGGVHVDAAPAGAVGDMTAAGDAAAAAPAATRPAASGSPAPSGTARRTTRGHATRSSAPAAPMTSAAPATTTVLGDPADTQWGVVQVRLSVRGGRIVAVRAVQSPHSTQHSLDINAHALPILAQQVLTAQGAKVDGVSGATVTSNGYRTSLQSAIDHAHLS